ncbi:THAP domain-containing protein 2-like [Gymnodraco acuticeps]|uniref:THAP domain-containing protein 2-like n=1 Tax=Gymnodraco acuticeps TaxID=8218 RepID=A0A6P8TEW6_GYMAC|nr:THAP domain-containing protein 2-like [Gymnodraco acuticeps]
MSRRKIFKTEHLQRQVNNYSEHCCVPLCTASAKFNGVLSFHGFPTELELRRQWLVKIRRDNFTISSHSKVCSRHFATDQLIEPKTLDGRRRLVKGAVPTLFEWNHFTAQTPRASVWERRERPTEPVSREEQEEHIDVRDHDYCSTPEPASLDMSSQATEDNTKTLEDLQKQLQELRVQRECCLQLFAGSDDNIRFYTRFPSYNHLMAFWFLIEPPFIKWFVLQERYQLPRGMKKWLHTHVHQRDSCFSQLTSSSFFSASCRWV